MTQLDSSIQAWVLRRFGLETTNFHRYMLVTLGEVDCSSPEWKKENSSTDRIMEGLLALDSSLNYMLSPRFCEIESKIHTVQSQMQSAVRVVQSEVRVVEQKLDRLVQAHEYHAAVVNTVLSV
eukprot:gnl/TRDRNA2_/TRDRNA2_123192_c1_seq1.p1 gnl/TRDRNA2_/TRDRNA2_123192_c1~~gnl/TRDRNA2_/TRDRNA2_123192_c1_seq1.p1  ORF type:complete len:138 (-),score=19.21 gnl/TRDRNA2_/TRDRNA2_123192_c1_seq1:6-374(-)